MEIVVVRHAIAAEPSEWAGTGRPDSERPLTDKGRRLMRRNARGIAAAAPWLHAIASSPFVRAMETAEILAREFRKLEVTTVPALASGGSREEIVEWLKTRDDEERIALVGHEPDLGRLVGWLVGGRTIGAIEMKKGGACLLRFAGHPAPGHGKLHWFLPPSLLRRLAD
jgi:phosphohistidine phosphatase